MEKAVSPEVMVISDALAWEKRLGLAQWALSAGDVPTQCRAAQCRTHAATRPFLRNLWIMGGKGGT